MRNIYKNYMYPPTQPYILPQADLTPGGEFDLLDPALAAELKAIEAVEPDADGFGGMNFDTAEATVSSWEEESEGGTEEGVVPPSPSQAPSPVVAAVPSVDTSGIIEEAETEAARIIAEARAMADEILSGVESEAMDELERLRSVSRDEGYRDGYARGMMDAAEQVKDERDAFGEEISNELKVFLESTSLSREKLIEETLEELSDLAIAVAEKVVRVSLKSSSGVIVKMIQNATNKLKRREWVHIYISGCDSKGLAEISPALSSSMSALSEHIRIIPMQDDEIGTCIIETPEEIIDASLSTQISNIKNLVFDQGSGRDVGAF